MPAWPADDFAPMVGVTWVGWGLLSRVFCTYVWNAVRLLSPYRTSPSFCSKLERAAAPAAAVCHR